MEVTEVGLAVQLNLKKKKQKSPSSLAGEGEEGDGLPGSCLIAHGVTALLLSAQTSNYD